jgi:hypothetical protein
VRAAGGSHIHDERPCECEWYKREKQRPSVSDAQEDEYKGKRQTKSHDFQEDSLSSLDDPKNVLLKVARH